MLDAPTWIESETRALLPAPPRRPDWPRVSIVVPTHDGRELLSRLLAGLRDETDYDAFDVVVVDNGSSDGTAEWLRGTQFPFALGTVASGRNLSFSAACNRGAAETDSELILFLNNDVEPLEPGWLKRLVTSLEASADTALAGAVLVDPALESESGRTGAVHHRDVYFRQSPRLEGALEPRPRGFGADLAGVVGPDRPAAAVTAASALVRRAAFESVQGFCELFVYGKEDVDLCLKLGAAGYGIVASGSTVLLHRRGAARRLSAVAQREVQDGNLRLLMERWGPRLRREYALDAAAGRGVWSDGAPASSGFGEGVSYCVLAADSAHDDDAAALARGLRDLGRSARATTEDAGWLLDDVIVHIDASLSPPATIPGRCNVLARLGGPKPPKRELLRFGVAAKDGRNAGELAAQVEDELERRGGRPRIRRFRANAVPPGASRAIFVLGMARTGTSATTRLLDLCGVNVGPQESLMSPNPDVNAKGFYEHFALMQVNVELLRRLGGSWRDPPDLPPGWELDPSLDDLREQAREVIAADFAAAPSWTFKDPRTSLTVPFWRPLVAATDFVICHRQPLDVVDSLARRDGMELEESLVLWERYTAASIAHTAGARRIFVGYDEYFESREGVLAALTRFVGRPGLSEDAEFRAQADAWLDADLRHHRRTHQDLLSEPAAKDRVTRLHLLLELAVRSREREPGLRGRGHGPVSDALDAVARESIGVDRAVPLRPSRSA